MQADALRPVSYRAQARRRRSSAHRHLSGTTVRRQRLQPSLQLSAQPLCEPLQAPLHMIVPAFDRRHQCKGLCFVLYQAGPVHHKQIKAKAGIKLATNRCTNLVCAAG